MQLALAIDAAPTACRLPARRTRRRVRRRQLLEEAPQLDLLAWHQVERPQRYGDCVGRPRPCPWFSCRHNLLFEVGTDGALSFGDTRQSIKNSGARDQARRWRTAEAAALRKWSQMKDTCALDVAARGWLNNEEIGELLGLTRERVRQMQADALRRVATGMDLGDRDVIRELLDLKGVRDG